MTQQILIVDAAHIDAARAQFPSMLVLANRPEGDDFTNLDLKALAGREVILWCHYAGLLAPEVARHAAKLGVINGDKTPMSFASQPRAAIAYARTNARPYAAHAAQEPAVPTPEPPEAPVAPRSASVTPITEARTKAQAKLAPDLDVLPAKYSHDALAAAFTAANPDLRHVKEWGRWLYWSGTYWEQDATGKVEHLSRQICRSAAEEARVADASYSTVRSIVHVATISAVEKLARSDPAHARSTDHWDSDPWLLNTPGGIVDLRDGSLRPGRPEDHQTKITRATPAGDCPQWCQFLIDATRGDGDLISFLGRMSGYWLTASIREHALFFFHGPGGNGKGTFLNTLAWVLGDYAGIAAMDMLTEQHNQQHLTFQAALKGRRLVVAQEVEEGKRWAEAKLNSLTGGDPITANYMRHDPFTFLPTHKFAISGNHKPIIRNVGDAIRRRMNLIPFTNKPSSPDKDLAEKLQAEAGGILRWAIAGCLEWQRFGLNPPEIVRAATEKYLASQDSMTTWITECCEDFPLRTPLKDLFDSYKSWCAANGETELGRKRFVEAIEARGHEVIEDRKHYFVRGLRLNHS